MEKEKFPKPPPEGIVYGEVSYWFLIAGVLIAIIGLVIYIASPGYVDKAGLLNYLWQGCDCHTIWNNLSMATQPPPWYSTFNMLGDGDMLATLGIAVTCFAAVFGMWGAVIQMARSRTKLYLVFGLIIAAVLTLSATGLVTVGS